MAPLSRVPRLRPVGLAAALARAGGCSSGGSTPTAEQSPRGLAGLEALAGEELRDTGPPAVPLPQVAAGGREDVPWALREPGAPGLPPPTVDLAEVEDGGQPPDGIPALDAPRFQRTGDVRWVDDAEQVLVVEVGGEARAYPVQVLTHHEIVNDTIAGVPVAVTYCPLCASGIAFDRRVAGRVLSFGTSGMLYRSDLVMYDRQTESLWPQIEGAAVAGVLTGTELPVVPAGLVSWTQWRQAHPDGWVLSRQTGFSRQYGANPYPTYDDKASLPLFLAGPIDNRIPWLKQPVVGIAAAQDALAIDVEGLRRDGVREVTVDGRVLTVWWLPGTRSSLDGVAVGEGREVARPPSSTGDWTVAGWRSGRPARASPTRRPGRRGTRSAPRSRDRSPAGASRRCPTPARSGSRGRRSTRHPRAALSGGARRRRDQGLRGRAAASQPLPRRSSYAPHRASSAA